MEIKRRGLMLILSSASGAGKTTIAKSLVAKDNLIRNSISVTTRPKRPSEVHGRDYFFVDLKTFTAMKENGEFLEHAQVFENHYGTPKQFVFDNLSNGLDILFDIDWQGAQQIVQLAHSDVVSVFILPPSLEELHQRLCTRAQDSKKIIAKRMASAMAEISHWAKYDYVLINRNLHHSIETVQAILRAERHKSIRQLGFPRIFEPKQS